MISVKDLKYRFTLRLTRPEIDFITFHALKLGVTPSHYLRLMIDHYMCSSAYLNAQEVSNEDSARTE